MSFEHLVVIGASAGGIEAITAIASRLDHDFPAPICLVVHTAPDSPNLLAPVIARAGALPAVRAESGTTLVPGCVRYRCHTGHAYSEATLHSEQDDKVEQALYNAMRALEERLMLLERMTGQEPEAGRAGQLRDELARTRDAADTVRALITSTAPGPVDPNADGRQR